jgi:hypothetical protein
LLDIDRGRWLTPDEPLDVLDEVGRRAGDRYLLGPIHHRPWRRALAGGGAEALAETAAAITRKVRGGDRLTFSVTARDETMAPLDGDESDASLSGME